ncbi:MAG: GGDEF domain-containing protein [Gammaproteobacteria bacterium]|nr:GGDEF domain-containing protein [Gammaproteobacteria bacterium]
MTQPKLMLKILNKFLSNLTCGANITISLTILVAIGFLDHISGSELAFSVFYTLPIALSAWYCGRNRGVIIAAIAAILWLIADISMENRYSSEWVPYWNVTIRFSMFLLISFLVSTVRELLDEEENLADIDSLTGIFNRHAFIEKLNIELERSHRYPGHFTLAFIDLDNFKYLNDQMGHHVGDEALVTVSRTIDAYTRHTDICARLGGDEFVTLLLNTEFEDSSVILKNIHNKLTEAMKNRSWPITFSIGAITVDAPCGSGSELMKESDALMYAVKKSGKSDLLHKQWSEMRYLNGIG